MTMEYEIVVLKDLWEEFKSKYFTELYTNKIIYSEFYLKDDNIRIGFSDGEGYNLLYNFLQTKKV